WRSARNGRIHVSNCWAGSSFLSSAASDGQSESMGGTGPEVRRGKVAEGEPKFYPERAMLSTGARGFCNTGRMAGEGRIGYNFRLFAIRNISQGLSHETHFPAVHGPPKEDARLSRPHEDGQRARDHQRAPGEGPQARRRLSGMPRA